MENDYIIATLDLRRHFKKEATKREDGQTHIDMEASKALAENVAKQYKDTPPEIIFTSIEVRTRESAVLLMERPELDGTILAEDFVQGLGGDEWTELFCFTPDFMAKLKEAKRKDYLAALIQHYGKRRVMKFAFFALQGVYEMMFVMSENNLKLGLAFGHSPDMLMFVPWALKGFPDDLSLVEHGTENLPEGEGWRVFLTDDRLLELGDHLSL